MGVMTMPNVYLRDGGANAKDLQSFPGNLRRKLIALHWSGVVFIVILLGLFTVSALGLFRSVRGKVVELFQSTSNSLTLKAILEFS
ncbi:hypothetical protein DM828_22320 [Pseudomonas umsongensis]|nr:hypothetical protein [Pseudomonas umsongensis]